MAFQDFGGLSERRRLERQQKLRKRIAIAAFSTLLLLLLIACGFFALRANQSNDVSTTANSRSDDGKPQPKDVPQGAKAIKMVCSSTDYRSTCEQSLTKALGSKHVQPKDLVKAAISVVGVEMDKAINRTAQIKADDPQLRGALQDCRELLDYALDDLKTSLSSVHGGKMIAQDLKTWLSAVVTYQETCLDSFPEGEFRDNMKKLMTKSRELTSNALAIVGEITSLMSDLRIPGINLRRRLLEEEQLVKGGMPSWMTADDRRLLQEHSANELKPDTVVAQDGSGNYKTINEALANLPKERTGRYVIYIKAGVYEETVIVDKQMENITMYGDGSRKTIVTGSKNFVDGTRTFQTATFAAIGDGFIAKEMAFRNTAGAIKHQAVALRVQSDRSIFLNCRMEGYQDTLYAQTHRQFYRSCVICGTVDFIFGDAAVVFQNCIMVVRKPLDNQQNIVTAQGRVDRHETTGIVIQNCRIIPDKKLIPVKGKIKSYLGRPWKEYSRTIIMETTIDDLISPDGWMPWDGDFALKTLFYGEYNNKGPGAALTARVKWPGYQKINAQRANQYTVSDFIQGDSWIKPTGTPVHLTLFS